MTTFKDYPLFKMRAGQDYKAEGSITSDSFENAKIEFAERCYNALINGYHGDDFLEKSVEEDGVEEDGVYSYGELFMPKSDTVNGIDIFSEDVYTWKLVDVNEEE